MMDDRIRVSDADREQVAARLREHFAEGRLTQEELDERISAALSAKTAGDLRRVVADLPGPGPASPLPGPYRQWGPCHPVAYRRGPGLLPVVLLAFAAALLIPGAGWLLWGFFNLILLAGLVAALTVFIGAARFRRRMRRHWHSADDFSWHKYQWHG